MQNLLNDPTFYKLLINNNESLIKDENEAPLNTGSRNHNNNNNTLRYSNNVEDFSFLKKLEFPSMNHLQLQPSISTETSYQSSVFSNNVNNSHTELIDINNMSLPDDFYSKEMDLQINGEIMTGSSEQSNSNSSISSTESTTDAMSEFQSQFPISQNGTAEPIQPKQFHKFYTSSSPLHTSSTLLQNKASTAFIQGPASSHLQQQRTAKITKPSLPSSSTIHICPFCQRQFKNKPYLARHLKKHDSVKEFKCPFFNESESKCHHLNGEFSRKDTFKAHLKSIHFIYPVGVFKSDRNLSIGRCAGCYKEFNNNNEWLNSHIESGDCTALVENKEKV